MKRPVELASLLAHELEPSLLSLESRLRSLLTDERRRDEVEACLAEVASLRSLIRDVLSLRTSDLEQTRFALSGILLSLAERFTPIARARSIDLRIPSTEAETLGNARATERVLSNLIDNAIKFSGEGTEVSLRVTPGRASVEIAVSDGGVGISAADQKRIFEPFVRLDRERPGSGLGLAIARVLAEAQGGELTLESRPGEGSRFLLTLRAIEP